MNPHYAQVALQAGHRCEYCHALEAVFNFPLEVEHIVPFSRGGGDIAANWALACRACNFYKATHLSGSDHESHTVVRLFHPREDRWEDHFQVATMSGEIVGCTPVGRVTVACLDMNSMAQVTARQQWMRLGLGQLPNIRLRLLKVCSSNRELIVVRYAAVYLATNRLTRPADEARRVDRIRSQIEELIRSSSTAPELSRQCA
jgi:hypothetical protein